MFQRTAYAIPLSFLCLTVDVSASDAVDFAASLIGRPYVWGAEGPNSFDCSGLTEYVYDEFGVDLPRRAVSQSQIGQKITKRLQRGDLVFFSTDTRRKLVTHVGIFEGNDIMINASKRHGRVRRDDLNEDYWADRFMFARRVAPGGRLSTSRAEPRVRQEPRGRTSARTVGRRAAILVLERIAEGILRPPR
jgi:hypothetical protein